MAINNKNNLIVLDFDNTIQSESDGDEQLSVRLEELTSFGTLILATGRSFENFATNFDWESISNFFLGAAFSNGGEIFFSDINFERSYFNLKDIRILKENINFKEIKSTIQVDFDDILRFEMLPEDSMNEWSKVNKIKIITDELTSETQKLYTLANALRMNMVFDPIGNVQIYPQFVSKAIAIQNIVGGKVFDKIYFYGDGYNDLSVLSIPKIKYFQTKDRKEETFNFLVSKLKEQEGMY
ncbi:hypothetical protein WFA24289_01868 [Periweissella fabaria]|uniref:HAD-IIB family hydrolase n=1 Tax=Periweissella fabaria TaxID=546157 RepID=A0ABM8Z8M9_9LACO|nr:HAD-IIB family hydrolase [Periweissella fabaria]CAH0417526.1 hypothetical protein WFA24289_01868 [Periweissella fabaria]